LLQEAPVAHIQVEVFWHK